MKDNEHIYEGLGELYGGNQNYCDLAGTCGVYVEGI
jgi:hypothetical protein